MKNNKSEERRHIFEEHDRTNSEGDYTVKTSKTADIIARILCVILAIFIWIYAVSSSNTAYLQAFDAVPVTVTGATEGYAVEGAEGISVTVTLKGRRGDLRKISGDDITATVDLSSYDPDFSSADAEGRITHKFDIAVSVNSKAAAVNEVTPSSVTLVIKKIGN